MDRKRFGGGKALAPIFGKKKPRQALLAHPNNSQSQPKTAPSALYGGGMHYGTTSKVAVYKNQPGISCGVQLNQQSHVNRNQFSSTRCHPQPQQQAKAQQGKHQYTNNAEPYRGSNITGMYEKNQQNNNSFVTHKVHAQPQLVQPSGTMPCSRTVQHSGIMPQSRPVHHGGTMPGRSAGVPVTPRNVRPGPGEAVPVSPALGQQAWGSPAEPPISKSHFTAGFYGKGSQSNQSITETVLHGSQTKKPTDSFESKGKSDTSLRVLTTTVATLRRWSQYTQKISLMFEVFGVLNSAVLTADKATAKEFVLKDDTGLIKCIFYQIDRDLDRMTRGHWYRCVGTMDVSTRRLRCVCVRPTSVEERRHSKAFVTASDAAMMEVIKRSHEM